MKFAADLRALGLAMVLLAAASAAPAGASTTHEDFNRYVIDKLVADVPKLLAGQDRKTGRFGKGIWIVNDQNDMYPLAVAWALKHPGNPHYHSPVVLEAIMAAGDALIADQDKQGEWVFRKKDGSTWGDTLMCWVYSRWIRSYAIIKDAMPRARRLRWEKALNLGFRNIARTQLRTVHNIPAHHGMGLFIAGKALGRSDWCESASLFMRRVADAQNPGGYWEEHSGPVVSYGNVYLEALGIYYAESGDQSVLPALERAARFKAMFRYPDGSNVETVDERNYYHHGTPGPNIGQAFTETGRRLIRDQWDILRARPLPLSTDICASFVAYARDCVLPASPGTPDRSSVLGNNDAVVQRQGPWFVCLSAFTAPLSDSRWIQDRQNFLSLYHDRAGLIAGGGNTKLQPLWSSFTVGKTSLLSHKPGDTNPDFRERPGLVHVPSGSWLYPDTCRLVLDYGATTASIDVNVSDSHRARLRFTAANCTQTSPVEAHLPLLARNGGEWQTASGRSGKLGSKALKLSAEQAGGWFLHAGWKVSLPPGSFIKWPVTPHDPYKKDGRASLSNARLVVVMPLTHQHPSREVIVEVPGN